MKASVLGLIAATALLAVTVITAVPDREAALVKPGHTPEASSDSFACQVASVTDGDTFRCSDGRRVRLHAISARERDGECAPGHPCSPASAEASTAFLTELTRTGPLTCRTTGQSYERTTAICWVSDGREINCEMVRSGMAVRWERFHRREPICAGARPSMRK